MYLDDGHDHYYENMDDIEISSTKRVRCNIHVITLFLITSTSKLAQDRN